MATKPECDCGQSVTKMTEQAINIQFVEEVEKHPCLYNYNLVEYSRKDLVDKAWTEVGKKVNLSGSQSKEKWKNLRAVFARQLKPADGDGKKKRPYYLTDYMQFTIPFIKSVTSTSRNVHKTYPEASIDEDEAIDDPLSMPVSSINTKGSSIPMSSPPPSINPLNRSPSPISCPSSPASYQSEESHVRKIKRLKQQPDLGEIMTKYFKAKKARLGEKAHFPTEDHRRMFLLSLIPDISVMTDTQMRTFKRRVLDVIEEILQESSQVPTQYLTINKQET